MSRVNLSHRWWRSSLCVSMWDIWTGRLRLGSLEFRLLLPIFTLELSAFQNSRQNIRLFKWIGLLSGSLDSWLILSLFITARDLLSLFQNSSYTCFISHFIIFDEVNLCPSTLQHTWSCSSALSFTIRLMLVVFSFFSRMVWSRFLRVLLLHVFKKERKTTQGIGFGHKKQLKAELCLMCLNFWHSSIRRLENLYLSQLSNGALFVNPLCADTIILQLYNSFFLLLFLSMYSFFLFLLSFLLSLSVYSFLLAFFLFIFLALSMYFPFFLPSVFLSLFFINVFFSSLFPPFFLIFLFYQCIPSIHPSISQPMSPQIQWSGIFLFHHDIFTAWHRDEKKINQQRSNTNMNKGFIWWKPPLEGTTWDIGVLKILTTRLV